MAEAIAAEYPKMDLEGMADMLARAVSCAACGGMSMPESVSLQAAFRLPPEEAVKYFESKGYKISFDWRQVWQEEHDRCSPWRAWPVTTCFSISANP